MTTTKTLINDVIKPLEQFTLEDMWLEHPDGSVSRSPEYARALNADKARKELVNAGVGERYWHMHSSQLTPTDALKRVLTGIKRYHEIKGHNLILSGGLGTGKTQAAILILKKALHEGDTALLQNLGLLAVTVRDGYSAAFDQEKLTEHGAIARMATPDVLILDDLGAGETSNAAVEKRLLYLALEQRCNNKKTTIITSNLTLAELVAAYGKRIFNRLQPSTTITFEGTNWRLEQSGGGW